MFGEDKEYFVPFEGVMPLLARRYHETDSDEMRESYENYMTEIPCKACHGARLKPETLAVTVGDAIEDMVTKRFADGEYASSVLLDAAATTAVEQLADGMEKAIKPKMAAQGYGMRWRFSPGYGDWPLDQQPELIRVTKCETIGISLSESKMLVPRKSVTAIIGLYKEVKGSEEAAHSPNGCAACDKVDCPSRKAVK